MNNKMNWRRLIWLLAVTLITLYGIVIALGAAMAYSGGDSKLLLFYVVSFVFGGFFIWLSAILFIWTAEVFVD